MTTYPETPTRERDAHEDDMADDRERPRWGCPRAWEHHILHTHPSGAAASGGSQMRPHAQLHSMRRDEAGRFNNLEGGIPRMLDVVLDDLQRGIEEEQRAGRFHAPGRQRAGVEAIDPAAIEAAIAQFKADAASNEVLARAYEVLRYFQSPPALRRFDAEGFACQLVPPTNARGLYRLKRWACYAVWERLPLAERLKASEAA